MTKENKELLIRDLSARLPYNVTINCKDEDCNFICYLTTAIFTDIQSNNPNYEYKPYLFPLSSLTSKQRTEIGKILTDIQKQYSPYGVVNTEGCDNLFICSVKQSNALINYCLSQHLDINGFIEKGLAEDATNLNIY